MPGLRGIKGDCGPNVFKGESGKDGVMGPAGVPVIYLKIGNFIKFLKYLKIKLNFV